MGRPDFVKTLENKLSVLLLRGWLLRDHGFSRPAGFRFGLRNPAMT